MTELELEEEGDGRRRIRGLGLELGLGFRALSEVEKGGKVTNKMEGKKMIAVGVLRYLVIK